MDARAINPDALMANAALKSLIDAVAFAAEKHRDQRRKDHHSSPYPQWDCSDVAWVSAVPASESILDWPQQV